MQRLCGVVLLVLLSKFSSFGQYYYYNNNYYDKDLIWEVGGSFGAMYGFTDVGKKKFKPFLPANLDFKSTKTNGGVYAGFTYRDIIAAQFEITYGSIAGADSNGRFKERNLNYRTSINEVALVGEVYPLMFFKHPDGPPRLSPYLAAGLGYFSFNPQAYYKGQYVNLQPLSTEGQGFKEYPNRKPYKLGGICVPFGGGLKYEISQLFNVRLEAMARYTFNDYLDDASNSSIVPEFYNNYFSPQKAALAAALTERSKERNPNSTAGITFRGGNGIKDMYLSFNIKAGLTLGRQAVH